MKNVLIAMFATLCFGSVAFSDRSETVNVVGSSTVYPFAASVAESFGESYGYNTPVIESTGSGGGMKLFCAGVGLEHPDVTNASRAMKESEAADCNNNGVEFTEFMVGYDGIVFANSVNGVDMEVTRWQLAQALTGVTVEGSDCSLVTKSFQSWSEVDSSLPNLPILVLGPPTSSGTRDALNELVVHAAFKDQGCNKDAYKAIPIRDDGLYVESGENDTLIIDQLSNDKNAFGIFGFSFLQNNADRVKGITVDGFDPTFDNIASGEYPVSRSLYVYVKNNHVGVVDGLVEFMEEFVEQAGIVGPLANIGLIPGGPEDQVAMYYALDEL